MPERAQGREEWAAMHRFVRHAVFQWLAVMVVVLTAMVVGAAALVASAHARDGGETRHAAELAGPAVVRIVNQVFGVVTCKECASNGGNVVFPDPQHEYVLTASGSGAFVSPDGYVLTAYHVVDPVCDDASNGPAFLERALQTVRKVIEAQGGTQAQADALFAGWESNKQLSIQCGDPEKTTVFRSTFFTGTLQSSSQVTPLAVTRIAAAPPAASALEGDDTAIIKVEASDVSFLSLAPASAIHVQDAVVAVAYPGDIEDLNGDDFSVLLDPSSAAPNILNDLLTPTVESGSITAARFRAQSGTAVYETSAIGFHGSSGGPVLNTAGQIVGFVDAGPDNARFTNLIASSAISKYVTQAGVSSPQGAFETLWTEAITEYDGTRACHWTNASADLKKLHQQYPQFGGVQPYLDTAQSNATSAECSTAGSTALTVPTPLLIAGGAGGALLLGLLGGLLGGALRGRRKSAELVSSATSGGMRDQGR